jgi:hypothetical protein
MRAPNNTGMRHLTNHESVPISTLPTVNTGRRRYGTRRDQVIWHGFVADLMECRSAE